MARLSSAALKEVGGGARLLRGRARGTPAADDLAAASAARRRKNRDRRAIGRSCAAREISSRSALTSPPRRFQGLQGGDQARCLCCSRYCVMPTGRHQPRRQAGRRPKHAVELTGGNVWSSGGVMRVVPERYNSQTCSCCGCIPDSNPKGMNVSKALGLL